MKISDNLRKFRLEKGLTQDDVAEIMHFTRQNISSYEAGRTQPDLETLQKLAEIYEVGIEEIIYGRRSKSNAYAALKVISIITGCLFIICEVTRSLLICISHTVYRLEVGPIPPDMLSVSEAHFNLLNISSRISYLIFIIPVVFVIMLVICIFIKRPVRWKVKVIYYLILAAAVTGIDLLFSLMDPDLSFIHYYLDTGNILAACLLILIISIVIDGIRSRRQASRI